MDELSPRARALLEAAHGTDDPIASDAARVRSSVLTRIGSTGLAAAVFSLSLERAKAVLGLATPKVVAIVLLAVGGSAVYQHLAQRRAELNFPLTAPAAVVAAAPVRAPEATPVTSAAVPVSSLPLLVSSQPRKARVARHVAARAQAAQAVDPNAGLEAEMRTMRAADAALRTGNVNEAEGLLEQHAREFPSGTLAEERDGLRIVASCQNGDADSQRAAAQFLERAPRSLIAARVRAACARPNGG